MFCTNVGIISYQLLVYYCWTEKRERVVLKELIFVLVSPYWKWDMNEAVKKMWVFHPLQLRRYESFQFFIVSAAGCGLLFSHCVIPWISNVCFNLTKLVEMEAARLHCLFSISRFFKCIQVKRIYQFRFKTEHYWLNEFILTTELSYCDKVNSAKFCQSIWKLFM